LSVTVLQHIIEDGEFKRAIYEVARVIKERGKALTLEASPRHPYPESSDFPTAYRSTRQWINAFDKNRLKIERIKGVELALFLRPLFAIKKRIFRNSGLYTPQLSAKPFPWRMQLAKAIYFLLINLAIVFSLPLDLSLCDRFMNYSLNKLFIFEKVL